jgi:hypothetical protein
MMGKKPILRNIQIAFTNQNYLDLYLADIGGDRHGFSGSLIVNGSVLQTLTGSLKGLSFVDETKNPGGRPTSAGKHAAVALAERLFQLRLGKLGSAREQVANLFNYASEREVRRITNSKNCPIQKHTILIVDGGEGGDSVCMALEDKDSILIETDRILISGAGWVWRPSEAVARKGMLTGEAQRDSDEVTGGKYSIT